MTCSYATKRNWQLLFVTKECDCARNVAKINTVLRKITSSSRNTAVFSRVDSDLHASTRHCSTGSTRLSTTSHTRKPRTDCGTQSDQHALAVGMDTAPHVSPHTIEPRTGLQRVQCNFAKKKQQKKNEFNSDLIKTPLHLLQHTNLLAMSWVSSFPPHRRVNRCPLLRDVNELTGAIAECVLPPDVVDLQANVTWDEATEIFFSSLQRFQYGLAPKGMTGLVAENNISMQTIAICCV